MPTVTNAELLNAQIIRVQDVVLPMYSNLGMSWMTTVITIRGALSVAKAALASGNDARIAGSLAVLEEY